MTMSPIFFAGRAGLIAGVLSFSLGTAGCLPKKSGRAAAAADTADADSDGHAATSADRPFEADFR